MTASSALPAAAALLAFAAVLFLPSAVRDPPSGPPASAVGQLASSDDRPASAVGQLASSGDRPASLAGPRASATGLPTSSSGRSGAPAAVARPLDVPGGVVPGARAGVAPAVTYDWPTVVEVEVLRAFDRPDAPWASGHRGVDLELAVEAPVHAAGDGVVAFAGVVVDRPVVSVQHPDGTRTTYEPVSPVVVRGQVVAAGDVIGHLATGGHCVGCLHWGARRGSDDYLDPLSLLRDRVVIRLLPGQGPG